jgi:hypothetical protein
MAMAVATMAGELLAIGGCDRLDCFWRAFFHFDFDEMATTSWSSMLMRQIKVSNTECSD